jgi:SAM-dependent methyltransferase
MSPRVVSILVVLLGLVVVGCRGDGGSPDGNEPDPSHADRGLDPDQRTHTAPTPPITPLDPVAHTAEGHLVRYLVDGDEAALASAAADAARLASGNPGHTYGRFLDACARRLSGDEAGEQAVLQSLWAEHRFAYQYFFADRPRDEVTTLLRCHHVDACAWMEASSRGEHRGDDPYAYVMDAEAPVTCDGLTVEPGSCPDEFAVLGRFAWAGRAQNRLSHWLPDHREMPMDEFATLIGLQRGTTVVDVGAGVGYFSFRFAEIVGNGGHVYAAEIDEDLVAYLQASVAGQGLTNVTVTPADRGSAAVPDGTADVAFVCETLARLLMVDQGIENGTGSVVPGLLADVNRALKPAGRLVVIDHDTHPDKVSKGKATPDQVIEAVEASDFVYVRTLDEFRPIEAVMIFVKK